MTRIFQAAMILPIILGCASLCLAATLDVTHEWKYIDYVWKSDEQKSAAVAAGTYDYTKIITHDVQPVSDGRIFVTTPKHYDNPASLSTISTESGDGGPLLAPYPDWSWHTKTDCSGITNVIRVFLDDYDRLWFVDSGKIGNEQVCPAKILVFDVTTDELVKEKEISDDLSHSPNDSSRGKLELFRVEVVRSGSDEEFWAYVSDTEGYGLVIWDGADIWRLDGSVFAPAVNRTNITIFGESYYTNTGVTVFLFLTTDFFDQLYILFRPEQGPINWVASAEDLHNSKSGGNITWHASDLQEPWVEPAKIIDTKTGALFSGFPGSGQVGCWNIQNSLIMSNVGYPAQDTTTMQHISSFKTFTSSEASSTELWATSNKYQKFVLGTMDFTEVNFRILTADVDTLIADTVCVVDEPKTGLTPKDIGFTAV